MCHHAHPQWPCRQGPCGGSQAPRQAGVLLRHITPHARFDLGQRHRDLLRPKSQHHAPPPAGSQGMPRWGARCCCCSLLPLSAVSEQFPAQHHSVPLRSLQSAEAPSLCSNPCSLTVLQHPALGASCPAPTSHPPTKEQK